MENGRWKMEKPITILAFAISTASRFDMLRFHSRPAERPERAEKAFSIFHLPFSIRPPFRFLLALRRALRLSPAP